MSMSKNGILGVQKKTLTSVNPIIIIRNYLNICIFILLYYWCKNCNNSIISLFTKPL